MDFKLYADESGTHHGDKCYTIGALVIPTEEEAGYLTILNELIRKHNISSVSEFKWSEIRNNHGQINFIIDIVKLILNSDISFICIVVWKEKYRNWRMNSETAFYKTYTMLMEKCTRFVKGDIAAKIDYRSDRYKKHNEVVEKIANYKLKDITASITDVEQVDSKLEIFVQIADLITGAINAGHNIFLKKDVKINKGKRILIKKIAECFSWDLLCYDTMPNANFDIWHFPMEEFRAYPKTKNIIPNMNVSYITADMLE